VEVDNNRLVGSEQALESGLVQCVRVKTGLTEDEKVIDVDDSNSDTGISEKSGSSNSLKGDFNTTSNKDDIGVDTVFGGESLPNRGTGDTVLLGLDISFA
jgi:hypothetical protein